MAEWTMKTRILGKDLKVSAVGLGCMGMTHASGAPADVKEMTELQVGFVAFSPLANGFLTACYRDTS